MVRESGGRFFLRPTAAASTRSRTRINPPEDLASPPARRSGRQGDGSITIYLGQSRVYEKGMNVDSNCRSQLQTGLSSARPNGMKGPNSTIVGSAKAKNAENHTISSIRRMAIFKLIEAPKSNKRKSSSLSLFHKKGTKTTTPPIVSIIAIISSASFMSMIRPVNAQSCSFWTSQDCRNNRACPNTCVKHWSTEVSPRWSSTTP
jgi:hypothetical protein